MPTALTQNRGLTVAWIANLQKHDFDLLFDIVLRQPSLSAIRWVFWGLLVNGSGNQGVYNARTVQATVWKEVNIHLRASESLTEVLVYQNMVVEPETWQVYYLATFVYLFESARTCTHNHPNRCKHQGYKLQVCWRFYQGYKTTRCSFVDSLFRCRQ